MPDLPPEEFQLLGHQLIDWLSDYLAYSERFPVLSRNQPGDLIDALPDHGPSHAEPMNQVIADFERLILPAVTHWNHPGFLAYFATSASVPGILAELLIAGLNTNGILWKTSPAVTELEIVVLDWLREWMGLPAQFGMIFDTASISSLHAIAAAREFAAPEIRQIGRSEKPLILYCSEHAHSSIDKAVIALGLGLRNIRKIAADAQFRMIPDALEAAIQQDLAAGAKPFCVVATVGTTSTTSIDPVPAIAAIAQRHRLWLHVDSAYAGSAAIVPEFQYILEGAELADSVVVNPHKWLFAPMDLSVLYTRRPEILHRAFSLVPDYLQTADDPRRVNFMEYGIPLGRRFRALKLWFIFRAFGRDCLAAFIRDQVRMAQELAVEIAGDECFEVVAPVPFSVVCFRLRASDERNMQLMGMINAEGDFYLSHTVLNGRTVLRIAIGNLGTTRETLSRLWTRLQQLSASLMP